jgi:hypothetical protein
MRRRVLLVVVSTLVGCVDERAAWRADALDVSGQWQLTSPTIADADVDIRIETDVNDISAVLRRGGDPTAVSADEADVIGRLQGANDRLLARSALELGTGIDAVRTELVGGENVSFDGGVTATVDIVSGAYAASTDGDDSLVRWGLSLTGDTDALAGVLFVTERLRTHRLGTSETNVLTQRSTIDVTLARR